MSIEDTLRRELHDATAQPPVGPSLEHTLASGRGRRRRRSLARVAGGSALAAAVAAGFMLLPGVGTVDDYERGGEPQWTMTVPPEQVNDRIVGLVRAALPPGTHVTDVEMKAWPPDDDPDEAVAVGPGVDDGSLPRDRWDEAASWSVSIELGDEHTISVELFHAASETEGDSAEACQQDLRQHSYLVCDVGTGATSAVETVLRVAAMRPGSVGWYIVDPDQADPDRLWFSRQLEAQPGGDFLLRIDETLKAPAWDEAEPQMVLTRDSMVEVVLNDDLLSAG